MDNFYQINFPSRMTNHPVPSPPVNPILDAIPANHTLHTSTIDYMLWPDVLKTGAVSASFQNILNLNIFNNQKKEVIDYKVNLKQCKTIQYKVNLTQA